MQWSHAGSLSHPGSFSMISLRPSTTLMLTVQSKERHLVPKTTDILAGLLNIQVGLKEHNEVTLNSWQLLLLFWPDIALLKSNLDV